ncbi:LLM class flavin-dependent oxidoreductase [Streptomyces radicis]|uniref:LLM class flavin-dependent oxidoreductase n=1 Tax=Streptomyces radicis TaxID=1750517 RepID=A0A3A9W4N3_9ACTN|nr:LLM class flavin-dependent oxidoreductase [Streptomyces radicis]RKN07810.1 LLM class flavin-dependent oxidoreductase [Streptomyces radicis]RKN20734.1 LLM class flavin-dependent oxidoreductase [Streptomyces radicis]
MAAPAPSPSVAFGLNVDPHAAGLPTAARIAEIADTAGLDYVGIQDHPYQADFLDTFTLITWLASRTRSVRFFPNVANLALRPPTMLAKQAASIDVLSGGRVELGLGSGGFVDAIAGMGGPRRSPGTARAALGEAVDIIRAAWAGQPYAYEGAHHTVPGTRPGPRPAHDIAIWLGVMGPKALALLGAKADGWSVSSPYVPPERLPGLNAIIDDAARDAGRDPARLTRLYNVMGTVVPTAHDPFNGPVEHWADTLAEAHTAHGMNTFVFWPGRDRERQARIFADEVVPAVRARLG